MSAALVAQLDMPQCVMDDLESTLYVILWMAIMYSSCSDISAIPAFLDHTLDPQIKWPEDCYMGKLDFLKGRSLLQTIKFVGQPAFDKLAKDLAVLFSAQYELRETVEPPKILFHSWRIFLQGISCTMLRPQCETWRPMLISFGFILPLLTTYLNGNRIQLL